MTAQPHLLLFGAGYVARRFARPMIEAGWTVSGTTRSEETAAELKAAGIKPVLDDGQRLKPLEKATHWLISAPPGPQGDPFLSRSEVLWEAGPPVWAGYLSTTGVYGDTRGKWVDERDTPEPETERGQLRLQAENDWLAFGERNGIATHVFRLGGIYGPGRSALDKVQDGTARLLMKADKVFNRIHVDDIINVLRASVERPRAGGVYNVVDGKPLPGHEVTLKACELLGKEPPPEEQVEDVELSPALASFYAGNVRIRSKHLEPELGVKLQFKDALQGLEALHEASKGS